jgi:AcrR family transcriptional regulator
MPRVGLTHERVVAEAAVVADEVGLESLTLAAVAKRVGVAIPSLYKHRRPRRAEEGSRRPRRP